MREQHRRECLVNDRESTRAAGSGVRSLWRIVPRAVKDLDYGFAAVPAADRIGGGFSSGGGSLTGGGLGGSSGCGGFGGHQWVAAVRLSVTVRWVRFEPTRSRSSPNP